MPFARSCLRVAVASALICVLSSQPLWGWGQDGHMMINRLAAKYLPSDVPAFARNGNALEVVEWLGPEPDRWRGKEEPELAATQAADHFIDLEYADYVGTLPRKRFDFIRMLATVQHAHPDVELTPEKVGLQPWQVEEMWERLKVDFREYRKAHAARQNTAPMQTAVLYDMGVLGHYVADGSMPLHTSFEYNGWTGPNPNGYTTEHKIHSLFESVYVGANIKRGEIEPLVANTRPEAIRDEWPQYMAYLRHTHTLVEKTYQLEKSGAFTGSGTSEGRAFADERLAAGAIELRDMIYSAWLHSADPVEEYHAPKQS